jgi:hypothetical protein
MITSRTITDLIGARGRLLHELCKELGVGKTQPGAERHFNPEDAALLALVGTLRSQGLRHSETIAIALAAKDALARFMCNPEQPERWLYAWRADDGESWQTEIVESSGSPEVYDQDGSRSSGYIVVNLRTLARQVIEVGTVAA